MKTKFKALMNGKAKTILLIILCLLVVGILIAYNLGDSKEKVENSAVNRGQVAKAVSLMFHSKSDIDKIDDKYFDGSDEWYVKYMNMMYKDSYYTEEQVKALEREVLKAFTYSDLENLFNNMKIEDLKLLSYVKNNKSAAVITLKEWNNIYKDLRTVCDLKGNIVQTQITIVGTISNVPTLKPWVAQTDIGQCGFAGLTFDYCIDKKVDVLMRDKEIITVLDVVDNNVTYTNAWVLSVNNGIISAFVEGVRREFYIDDKSVAYNNVTADIVLENKKLKDYIIKDNFITGKVLAITDSEIEIEGHGKFPISKDMKVYSLYGELVKKNKNDILIGYDVQRFVVSDNQISSVVIDRDFEAVNIRVLLKNTGYEDIYHDEFIVRSNSGFTVRYGNKVDVYNSDIVLTINSQSACLQEGRVSIIPNSSGDKLTVESITRNGTNPSYRGSIELIVENDKLIVINDLSIEEYLYGVVPSEMPWSYNEEALKAQAVCARTYAYRHLLSGAYGQYGAHVDDSTGYQVYNVSGEQETTTKAVNDTKGQILTYEGEAISAYFFSTSCGSTTNAMVWGSDLGYVKGALLSDGDNNLDLKDESVFDTFIRTGFKTFDSSYPWYRWQVTMSMDEISNSVNRNLQSIYEANTNNVKVLNKDGKYVSEKIVGIGNVSKIEEGTRNTGGVLDYVTIYGAEKTVRVYREYNIRKVFDITGLTITRTNGEDVNTMSMLPSAYVVFDENMSEDVVSSYTIIGGGYGHGVGLSQNGANSMAKEGYTYDKILNFFYNDITIEQLKN